MLFDQNFLFTSKDESSQLKAIDFGLSDFVKPGAYLIVMINVSTFPGTLWGLNLDSPCSELTSAITVCSYL